MGIVKKCQICDGPIVNGRCKYCGMPYRNDEELYHLNEDRREHYRHANKETREKMREAEIPLPDRDDKAAYTGQGTYSANGTSPGPARQRENTTGSGGSKGKNASAGMIYIVILLITMIMMSYKGCR